MKRSRSRAASRSRPPSVTDRPLLDACLIVRDEERYLPGCLESLKSLGPLLNRIHVYDTGSADRTVNLARSVGCDVVEGYWDDDFARARNESLRMSEAQWALVIDADERLVAEPARLAAALESAVEANVIDAELHHIGEDGRRMGSTRYIKAVRPDQIRFTHPVHEIAAGIDGATIRIAPLGHEALHFTHLGYASTEMRQLKAARNHAVADAAVESALAADDMRLMTHALHHRGRSAALLGRQTESLEDVEQAWRLRVDGTPEWVSYGDDLVRRLLSAKLSDKAAGILDDLEARDAPRATCLLLRGEVALARGDAVLAGELTQELLGLSNTGDVDPRQILDLKLRAALAAQGTDAALAVALVLVGHGEADRLAIVCELWRGTADQLVEVLKPYRDGVHGSAIVAALGAHPGLGAQTASLLVGGSDTQHPRVAVDEGG